MLYHDHVHNLVGCTSCSDALACNAKMYKQIYLSTAGKGLTEKDSTSTEDKEQQIPNIQDALMRELIKLFVICTCKCYRPAHMYFDKKKLVYSKTK